MSLAVVGGSCWFLAIMAKSPSDVLFWLSSPLPIDFPGILQAGPSTGMCFKSKEHYPVLSTSEAARQEAARGRGLWQLLLPAPGMLLGLPGASLCAAQPRTISQSWDLSSKVEGGVGFNRPVPSCPSSVVPGKWAGELVSPRGGRGAVPAHRSDKTNVVSQRHWDAANLR